MQTHTPRIQDWHLINPVHYATDDKDSKADEADTAGRPVVPFSSHASM